MNCTHPQNNRFVHISSQVFLKDETVVRDEDCLVCGKTLHVIYVNGQQTNVSEVNASTTIDIFPPQSLLPESHVTETEITVVDEDVTNQVT